MSLGKKVFNSAVLLLLRKIWGNVINLIVMAFLARLLSKEDFGLLAISSVFLSIINTLSTSGISEYVVYYDGDDRKEKVNASFWLNLLLTIAVVGVVVVTGRSWADFYNNPKVYPVLLLLLVSFFFEMTSSIPKALLRKELEYKTLVYYSSVSMTAISAGKLLAAFAGFGVYSLVLPQAVVAPFSMLAFFFKTCWVPKLNLGIRHFAMILNYTKHIVGSRVLTRLVNEGDNLIVGKFLGLEGLGVYTLAFQLANLVTTNIVVLVNEIFLPLLSKVKHDLHRLRAVYLKVMELLSMLSFPLITTLAICAESIVVLIYGTKWVEAVLPFQIMCLFALGRSVNSPSSNLFNALGKPQVGFYFSLYFVPCFLLAALAGSQFGLMGVTISVTAMRIVGSVLSLRLSLNLLNFSLSDFFYRIRASVLTSVVVVIIFSFMFIHDFSLLSRYSLLFSPVILVTHLIFMRLLFKEQLLEAIGTLETYLSFRVSIFRRIMFIN
jgi:teichuronic acid exporter